MSLFRKLIAKEAVKMPMVIRILSTRFVLMQPRVWTKECTMTWCEVGVMVMGVFMEYR